MHALIERHAVVAANGRRSRPKRLPALRHYRGKIPEAAVDELIEGLV